MSVSGVRWCPVGSGCAPSAAHALTSPRFPFFPQRWPRPRRARRRAEAAGVGGERGREGGGEPERHRPEVSGPASASRGARGGDTGLLASLPPFFPSPDGKSRCLITVVLLLSPLILQRSSMRWDGKTYEEIPIAHIKATYNK